jgi:hypothetical protein
MGLQGRHQDMSDDEFELAEKDDLQQRQARLDHAFSRSDI